MSLENAQKVGDQMVYEAKVTRLEAEAELARRQVLLERTQKELAEARTSLVAYEEAVVQKTTAVTAKEAEVATATVDVSEQQEVVNRAIELGV